MCAAPALAKVWEVPEMSFCMQVLAVGFLATVEQLYKDPAE